MRNHYAMPAQTRLPSALCEREGGRDYELICGEGLPVERVRVTYTIPTTPVPPQTTLPPALNCVGHTYVAFGQMLVIMIGLSVYHVPSTATRTATHAEHAANYSLRSLRALR